MSKRSFLTAAFLVCFATATSMVGNDAAMSDPVLIDPSSQYYGNINNYSVEGYAYDFCYQEKTLGFIVFSKETAERLERRYPVRDTCSIQVNSVIYQNSAINPTTASQNYFSSSKRSTSTSGICNYEDDRDSRGYRCGKRAKYKY